MIGEVKRPGVYEILGEVSVIEAISMAGGFSQVADQRSVKIIRKKDGKQSAIPVDTTRITQRGDTNADVSIEADDVISVGKSFF
jgi:polysaccharide export outer membrane protein